MGQKESKAKIESELLPSAAAAKLESELLPAVESELSSIAELNQDSTILTSLSGPVSLHYLNPKHDIDPIIIIFGCDRDNQSRTCDNCNCKNNKNCCYNINSSGFHTLLNKLGSDNIYYIVENWTDTTETDNKPKDQFLFNMSTSMAGSKHKITVNNILDEIDTYKSDFIDQSLIFIFMDITRIKTIVDGLNLNRYYHIRSDTKSDYTNTSLRCLKIPYLLNLTKIVQKKIKNRKKKENEDYIDFIRKPYISDLDMKEMLEHAKFSNLFDKTLLYNLHNIETAPKKTATFGGYYYHSYIYHCY